MNPARSYNRRTGFDAVQAHSGIPILRCLKYACEERRAHTPAPLLRKHSDG